MVCGWLVERAPLSQPVRSKTKTGLDLAERVFPRYMFLLPIVIGPLCCDWLWFYEIQLETALYPGMHVTVNLRALH